MALINFTNHPSGAWSPEQLAAAARYGEIIDISFPAVDPNADEENVTEEEIRMMVDVGGEKGVI